MFDRWTSWTDGRLVDWVVGPSFFGSVQSRLGRPEPKPTRKPACTYCVRSILIVATSQTSSRALVCMARTAKPSHSADNNTMHTVLG